MEAKEIQEAITLLQSRGYEVIPPQSLDSLNEEFEQWWNLYNKKRGKPKCLNKWLHMTKKDRAACIAATPKYVASITNKVYQKDPLTYLNGRAWEDEIYSEYDGIQEQQQRQELSFARTAAAVFNAD